MLELPLALRPTAPPQPGDRALFGFPSSSGSQYCILQLLLALARYLHTAAAAAAAGNHTQRSHLQQGTGVCDPVVGKCRGR